MKILFRIIFFIILLSSILHLSAYANSQEKVWLGLTVTKTENKEFSTSIVVKEVEIGSPAEKSGIIKGDLIDSINKKKTKNPIQYIKAIKSFAPNDTIEIGLIRNKIHLKKEVVLSSKKINTEKSIEPKQFSLGFYGITKGNKKEIRANYFSKKITDNYLFLGSKNETLIVTCIKKGSNAEKSGIKLYDEILEVDGKIIKELPNFNFSKKRNINIKLIRNGKVFNIKVKSEHSNDLAKLSHFCVNEYKEYECASFIEIAFDRRDKNYFDNIFNCTEEKNVFTIPFGPIPHEYNWIKVKTLTNIIKVYANKQTRNFEKLDHYLPIASEILNEIDIYLNKGEGANKNKDKDPIALTQYKNLRKSVSYAIKYAQVKGLKDMDVFQMNVGTISGYKKAIVYLINKNQKISHLKRDIFNEAFEPLMQYDEKEFIKTNWPKAIKLIDWKSLSLAEIKNFRIFYNLGDLYASEAKFEESIKYYEMGINKLNEWAEDLPPSRLYAVYKRRMHVRKSLQISLFATEKYNTTFGNKYLKMLEKDLKDSEKEIEYFYSLPIKIKKEIRVKNPKHLSDIYNSMNVVSSFQQKPDKAYEFAIKGLNEIEKYSIGKNRNEDLFGAYHMAIISSIGSNNLKDAVYYLNQSKNIATQLVSSPEGVETVGTFTSFQLPFLINAGLYAEAEDLINYVYSFMDFNYDDVISEMQSDTFNYSLGRINLVKKDYPKAISHFELASVNYLKNPGSGVYSIYSAFSNLLLLEAYLENDDFVRFEKQFQLVTGKKPINYASLDTSYDLIGTSIGKSIYVPAEIDISMLAALLKYLEKKQIKISKKDSKEFFSHLKDYFKDYAPGEESRLEMVRNSVKASSLLALNDLKSSETFLLGIIPNIKNEYSSELYTSNLSPIHKIDDIIEGYLNASYYSKNKKFFDKSYKIIQIVSNSITAKDIKKSIKTKKFQDPEANKLIKEYQKLQIEKVSFTSAEQFKLSTAGETTYSERELFDVGRSKEIDDELKNLEKKIKVKTPSYFNKIKPSGASLKQIQKKLSESQALVEYFFFEDKFYILIIKKDGHKILKINNTLEYLEKSAQKLKLSISINDQGYLEKFNALEGYKIYKAIFAPIENYINKQSEIIVIPNKFLKNIPLHLLPTTKTEKCMDCSNVEWLMNKYDFAYIPNAEFFTLQKNKKIDLTNLIVKTNKTIFLGIGNPNLEISKEINTQKLTKRIDKLSKILSRGSYIRETNVIKEIYGLVEGSQEELETIQEYLKPSKSKLLLWEDANESNIKNMNLKDFKIIHFATHGELAGAIKGQNEPFLVLSPPDVGTNENDGILTMSEIMNLENNAELVILSACNTAAGNIKQSEGFSGLARAFLFSGSKSVLVSNWYVETYAAMELTTGMMKQIKDNPKTSGSKALTGSMKNFISNNKEKSHPFYWAPFVIVGLNSNININ